MRLGTTDRGTTTAIMTPMGLAAFAAIMIVIVAVVSIVSIVSVVIVSVVVVSVIHFTIRKIGRKRIQYALVRNIPRICSRLVMKMGFCSLV